MDPAITKAPSAAPVDAGKGAEPALRVRGRWSSSLRPSPAEWLLFAYLALVIVVTVVSYVVGHSVVDALASSPDDVAGAKVWALVTSGLLADGPLVPQVLVTAVLGVWAIRLAGGRVFWAAALLAHVLGTMLVYAGVWVVDAQDPSLVAALSREADFGVSLVWCAALGVLAAVAWWGTRPLRPRTRRFLAVAPPAALVGVTALSQGLALYEHVVAFVLAVGVVYASRRWSSLAARLRLVGPTGDH
jgi:hypothetical protein